MQRDNAYFAVKNAIAHWPNNGFVKEKPTSSISPMHLYAITGQALRAWLKEKGRAQDAIFINERATSFKIKTKNLFK
ncbi:MAG: hypothetical protein SPL43_07225 [Prevotella sp.]|nr:hypothetical protein [Prevotella sp.]